MSFNTYDAAGIAPRINQYAEPKMLKTAAPVIVIGRFGMARTMPKNKSSTISFRRARPFAAATTPLQEGVPPNSSAFAYDTVEGTMEPYGMVSTWSDEVEDTHEDPVVRDIVRQMGLNLGRTTEALNYSKLRAGTSVYYANGSSRAAVNTTLTYSLQRRVIAGLKRQKAVKISSVIDGSTKIGTSPIEAAYIGICHTDIEPDIRNMPGFTPCAKYGMMKPICAEEIGSVEEVRYITSPDLDPFVDAGGTPTGVNSTSGSAADVYPILYLGEDAFGVVTLQGYGNVQPTLIPAGTRTKDDPLGQVGKAGWKSWHLCLILNDSWMARAEVAASDLLS